MNKKNPYPTLSELGVNSPLQVSSYHITNMNQVDVLRIVYERPKGSFLTSSKTYRFPRVQEDAAVPKAGTILKTHPKLLAAIEELDELLKVKSSKETIAAKILSEIELLEEDIAMRTECLKVLAGRIPTAE